MATLEADTVPTRKKQSLYPIALQWRREAKKLKKVNDSRKSARHTYLKKKGEWGISFQFPPGWDDGSGKVRHVESGPFKGRVYWQSRQEAIDIGKRHEDKSGTFTSYDPD